MASHIRTHLILSRLPGFETGSIEAPVWQPRLDIYEMDDAILIQIEAPGLHLEDLDLQWTPGQLLVAGVRSRPPLPGPARAALVEMNYGAFRRRIPLPDDVRGDAISARYENGILLITAPRVEKEVAAPVKISIR